jgi:two-component system, sensor histidine kinase
LVLGGCALALIWAGTLFHLNWEYKQTDLAAKKTLTNLATLFEEQTSRMLGSVDQTLKNLRDVYLLDKKDFDIVAWSARVQAITDFAFQTVIIGPDGYMVASSIVGAERLDLSDREHFRAHADRKVEGLFVSKPIVGRVSGRATIQMSRRIENSDGSFGGVVVMSVDPSYLAGFYGSIDLGAGGLILLVGTDGVVRVRKTPGNVTSGVPLRGGRLFEMWKANPESGVYEGLSPSDNTERMVAYHQVAELPLIVAVASGIDDIFAGYRRDRAIKIIMASLLSLCFLAGTLLNARYQRRLALARDAAEAGTRARSTFLAAMSHEIRTPMNAVLGLASSLIETPLDDGQRQSVAAINDSGSHLLRILNDILDFSKMEAGQVELERIAFSPEVVAANTLSVISARARAKGLAITLDCSSDLPVAVAGDAGRVSQILMNLVSNAVKFTDQGTVTIKVECLGRKSGNAVIKWNVIDSGPGIPAERIEKLFGEFVQADNSIARRYGGSGLGLAICKRLVGLMGGDIGVTSREGQGSEFWVRLTLPEASELDHVKKEARSDKSDVLAAAIKALGRPAHVLLAEDNATNQMVVRKMLDSFNIALTVAADGAEAVEAVSNFPFDIVFMDMCMPNMDGLQAAAAIRAHGGALAQLPIVALTANVFPEDIKACRDAGMGEFIAKPMRKHDLVEAMARALSSAARVTTPVLPAAAVVLPAADAAAEKANIEHEKLDELEAEIGLDGLAATLVVFLHETEASLRRFETLSCDKDRATIKVEAHTLKGASATVGLVRLAAMAKELEATAAEIATDRYVAAVARLKAVFADGRGYLDRRLGMLHETTPPITGPQESEPQRTTLHVTEQKSGPAQRPPKRKSSSTPHAGKTAAGRKPRAPRWEALERAALKERLRIWKEQGSEDYQGRLVELSGARDHEKVPPHLRERLEWQLTRPRRDLRDPTTGQPRSIQDLMAAGEYDPINPKHRLSLNKYEKGNRSHHPLPRSQWKQGPWVLGHLERPNAQPAREGYDYTHAWPERAADHARTALDRSRDESLPPSPPPERLPEIVDRGVGTGASGRQAAA